MKPNILLILTDQQSAKAMSCVGNENVQTTAMDSLAAKGTRFENAYCANPLCTPARASIFTGMMPHEAGVDDLGQPLDDSAKDVELGHLLKRAGYECLYGGKWHLPEMSTDSSHGFLPVGKHNDHTLVDDCIKAINSRDTDNPFFMVASFDDPHNICDRARFQNLPWGTIEEVPLKDCPSLPSNYPVAPFAPSALSIEYASHPLMFCGIEYTPEEWRQYLHVYYRMVERVDQKIGLILDCLKENRLEKNTVVIFSSDHGDGMAAHRWNQKIALYEETVKVPLIICDPQNVQPGVVKAPVSAGYDLYATICDYAGMALHKRARGRSLRDYNGNFGSSDVANVVFAETFFNPSINPNLKGTKGRMVRTDQFKYVVYSWGKYREQLHDMENDPGEMVNLALDSRYTGQLQRHRSLLLDWIVLTDDHAAEKSMRCSIVPL